MRETGNKKYSGYFGFVFFNGEMLSSAAFHVLFSAEIFCLLQLDLVLFYIILIEPLFKRLKNKC